LVTFTFEITAHVRGVGHCIPSPYRVWSSYAAYALPFRWYGWFSVTH